MFRLELYIPYNIPNKQPPYAFVTLFYLTDYRQSKQDQFANIWLEWLVSLVFYVHKRSPSASIEIQFVLLKADITFSRIKDLPQSLLRISTLLWFFALWEFLMIHQNFSSIHWSWLNSKRCFFNQEKFWWWALIQRNETNEQKKISITPRIEGTHFITLIGNFFEIK